MHERKPTESHQPNSVNVAFETYDGSLIARPVKTNDLPKHLRQAFQWSEEVKIMFDHAGPEAKRCWLLKVESKISLSDSIEKISTAGVVNHDYAIILHNGKFIVVAFENGYEANRLIDELAQPLMTLFDSLEPMTCQLANDQELTLIKATLGNSCEFRKDDITTNLFNAMMAQVRANYSKLAIKWVNDIVGYGVVAIQDIPEKSILTHYSGTLLMGEHQSTDYGLGDSSFTIDAKDKRNFAGFISHAFQDKDKAEESKEVLIKDFCPVQENAQKVDDAQWRKSVVSANIKPVGASVNVYKHTPYAFFANTKLIKKGDYLAWDYGVGYWKNKGIKPALVKLSGEVVSPDSYRCNNVEYNKIALRQVKKPSADAVSVRNNRSSFWAMRAQLAAFDLLVSGVRSFCVNKKR